MAIWIDDSILLRLSLLGEHGKLKNISNSEEKENRGQGEARGGWKRRTQESGGGGGGQRHGVRLQQEVEVSIASIFHLTRSLLYLLA